VISPSSNGFRGGSAARAAPVATQEQPDGEGKAAAATAVNIPVFKTRRRFSLEEVLDLFVWSKVFDFLLSTNEDKQPEHRLLCGHYAGIAGGRKDQ
jgi:hypothetical protein